MLLISSIVISGHVSNISILFTPLEFAMYCLSSVILIDMMQHVIIFIIVTPCLLFILLPVHRFTRICLWVLFFSHMCVCHRVVIQLYHHDLFIINVRNEPHSLVHFYLLLVEYSPP